MYCPECGNDAGDAKYCPECGADLANLKSAMQGKTTGRPRGRSVRSAASDEEPQAAAPPPRPAGRGLSPAVIWGGFGALAIVVIVVVVMASGGFGGEPGGSSGASPSVTAVQGVTTGSFESLVQKGNELYDKGDAAFQKQQFEQGAAYFRAAAMTYAAAWNKQKTAAVGTDLATALFYSGDIGAALEQIDAVIRRFPTFQKAHFNLGNYLAHKARIAEQQGDNAAAKKEFAAAADAYAQAIKIDSDPLVTKQAEDGLKALQK